MVHIAREITRFSSKKELDKIFKKARRAIKTQELVILVAPARKDIGRILVIASRKVGKAHERNKIRRQMRSIFYEEALFKQGLDCIVIVKPGGIKLPFAKLKQLLIQAVSTNTS